MTASLPDYRRNVGIILMNKDGLVLAGRRTKAGQDGTLQMPQGGVGRTEKPIQAARRELFEETGVNEAVFLKESANEYSYLFPKWVRKQRSQSGMHRYIGQSQKWFLFIYTGKDIEADLKKRQDKELTDFEWVDIRILPEKVIPFKRDVYTAVVNEFGDYIKKIVGCLPKKIPE